MLFLLSLGCGPAEVLFLEAEVLEQSPNIIERDIWTEPVMMASQLTALQPYQLLGVNNGRVVLYDESTQESTELAPAEEISALQVQELGLIALDGNLFKNMVIASTHPPSLEKRAESLHIEGIWQCRENKQALARDCFLKSKQMAYLSGLFPLWTRVMTTHALFEHVQGRTQEALRIINQKCAFVTITKTGHEQALLEQWALSGDQEATIEWPHPKKQTLMWSFYALIKQPTPNKWQEIHAQLGPYTSPSIYFFLDFLGQDPQYHQQCIKLQRQALFWLTGK